MKNQLNHIAHFGKWIALAAFFSTIGITTAISGTANSGAAKKNGEEVQRAVNGAFDLQRNVVSRIDFYTTNYGIFGLNIRSQRGGTFWPRGSDNQYIFGSGVWFGALKIDKAGVLKKRTLVTYNPNSGQSWVVPGTIEDGELLSQDGNAINKNRLYFSSDFNQYNGVDFSNPTYPLWPIWDSSPSDTLRVNNYFGYYVNDITQRDRALFTKGPAFISGEDVFSVYKDTDLSWYEGGKAKRESEGFPLGFQIEQMIYSWGFGDYADFVFLKYMFIHPKQFPDTLKSCWMASIQDVDITLGTNPISGAENDRAKYYDVVDTLNMAIQWTDNTRGEANRGFGYLGFTFLESPAVDADGFIRKDKKQFKVSEQLGLRTFKTWPILQDPLESDDRYNFMSGGNFDPDFGPGDRRMLMATGPFNMRPGDTARIVVGIILAATSSGKDATGTPEDTKEIQRKVEFAQFVYNNQFRAPEAPNLSVIKGYPTSSSIFSIPEAGWMGLNNAVAIQWDSTAELSVDTLENGLDFMGYRIYRARRTDLDTYNIDYQPNNRKGPLAWKEIAVIPLPPIYLKSQIIVERAGIPIDDFEIVQKVKASDRRILVKRKESNASPWWGYWLQLLGKRDSSVVEDFYKLNPGTDSTINLNLRDRFDSVKFVYFTMVNDSLPPVNWNAYTITGQPGTYYRVDSAEAARAKDTLMALIQRQKVKMQQFLFDDTVHVRNPDNSVSVVPIKRPFEELYFVRHGLIAPYMKTASQDRISLDFGDDNPKDGIVSYDPDPEKSEKLINNVDYYYAIRAYDEGDFVQQTESKLNFHGLGALNTVTATPLASRPGYDVSYDFSLLESDKPKIGGIYNLKLQVQNEQLFNQLFAGRTLELEFFRSWLGIDHDAAQTNQDVGAYGVVMKLRDSASRQLLATWESLLPPQLCGGDGSTYGYFSENALVYVDMKRRIREDSTLSATEPIYDTVRNSISGEIIRIDTTTFHLPDNTEKVLRGGHYTTTASCFGGKYALGTVGISFDYTIEQWGGQFRPGKTADVISGPGNMYIGTSNVGLAFVYNNGAAYPIPNRPPAYIDPPFPGWDTLAARGQWQASYNNGPGIYEVTFSEGGTEDITTSFLLSNLVGDEPGKESAMVFPNVPYLNMSVRNVSEYKRPDQRPDGTLLEETVSYPFDYAAYSEPYPTEDSVRKVYPNQEAVPIGSFAAAAYGNRNSRAGYTESRYRRFLAADLNSGKPLGLGRYYVSRNVSTAGKDTLDFVNILTFSGCQFTIDFSWFQRRNASWPATPNSSLRPSEYPAEDFKPGDKIRLYVYGGALGYPFDGAKAFAHVNQYDPELMAREYSDDDLSQVQVVPNPYYVTHEGIRSPFEGRLYFTRLPRRATISIFTTNGDLIRKYEHDESTSENPSTFGTYVWDLLSGNNQRVASQMLVAKIETPSGASVIKKFTVVVGPARIPSGGE
ncbi:MAG: hypothetical protein HYX66_10120 [Ignavibacteria bacterium]|nr:hypothetical protein [Ignavibacteria bacterium]